MSDINYPEYNLKRSIERYLSYTKDDFNRTETHKSDGVGINGIEIFWWDIYSNTNKFVDSFISRYIDYSGKSLPYPLVITSDQKELIKQGIEIYSPFLLEMDILKLPDIPKRYYSILKYSKNRNLYRQDIKDFFIGYLRKELGIGEHSHDTNSEIYRDLRELKNKEISKERLKIFSMDNVSYLSKIKKIKEDSKSLSKLFEKELKDYKNVLEALSKLCETKKSVNEKIDLIKSQSIVLEESFPRKMGFNIRFLSVIKPEVLLIDDNAIQELEKLNGTLIDGISLKEFFNFYPLKLKEFHGIKSIKKIITVENLHHFDFILLDLSFSEENSGEEPLGYTILSEIRRELPDIPIIIYSAFGQSKYIIKAIQNCADWYCRKDQAYKLPNYLLNVITHSEWKKEFERKFKREGKKEVKFVPKSKSYRGNLKDEEKYLIASLVDQINGKTIEYSFLTEGIGGASTLWINKKESASSRLVVKLDNYYSMQSEKERYLWLIKPYLTDYVGDIISNIVRGDKLAGIAYKTAGKSLKINKRIELASLKKCLVNNIRRTESKLIEFNEYIPFLNILFDNVLKRLHSINISDPLILFPSELFEESEKPVFNYNLRLPIDNKIELEVVTSPDTCSGIIENNDTLIINKGYLQEVGKEDLTIISSKNPNDKDDIQRIRMVGDYAKYIARNFYIRVNKNFKIEGRKKDRRYSLWGDFDNALKLHCPYIDKFFETYHIKSPLVDVNYLLKVISKIEHPKKGIIHGDLNLSNIMTEIDKDGLPVPIDNHPWLIDFARTRRDSIVFDFAEMESSLITNLVPEYIRTNAGLEDLINKIIKLIENITLDKLPVGNKDVFVYDFINYIRKRAFRAGILKEEYLASVSLDLLIVFKIKKYKGEDDEAIKILNSINNLQPPYCKNENPLIRLICYFFAAFNIRELKKLIPEHEN